MIFEKLIITSLHIIFKSYFYTLSTPTVNKPDQPDMPFSRGLSIYGDGPAGKGSFSLWRPDGAKKCAK
jgi:hypothetical protein